MSDETVSEAIQPRPMSFSELMTLMLKFNDRLDTLWQRVLYTHAALVGVMVFFARSPEAFVVPKLLVFFFYTVNAVITYSSVRETYRGYRSAVLDLSVLKDVDATSNVQGWIRAHRIGSQPRRYGIVFILIWAVIGYLLLVPLAGR